MKVKQMSDKFDPFSGGPSSYYSPKKENKKSNSFVTVILVIILIGFGIYYGMNFLFLSKVDASFNVLNTEGENISATIKLSKDPMFSDSVINLQSGIKQEIKTGTYYYSARASGYISVSPNDSIEIKEDFSETIELEKEISLKINKIEFPEKVFINQSAILKIEVANTSTKEIYDISNIVIEGDLKDWEFDYINDHQEILSEENIVIPPKQSMNINLRYIVKETKNKKNDIKVRVKYKSDVTKANFEIIETPEINISGNLEKTIESGKNNNFTISIGNKKNKSPISDLKIELEINSENNENIEEWFTYDKGNILIPASQNTTISLLVEIPQYAREDNIVGELIFISSAFKENKIIPIKINIQEPTINFDTKLDKSTVNLDFDVNKNTVTKEYITLILDNKSTIDLDIVNLNIVNLDPDIKDCNNLIYISENSLPNKRVIRNIKPEIPITISAKDISLVNVSSRICGINVEYKHPFRVDETIIISKNIIINIEDSS
jgi:hypothetical protein